MHDFTESDLFTIDGDSVLADIFARQGLDFTHGGQLLHFVYLMEHFLQVSFMLDLALNTHFFFFFI